MKNFLKTLFIGLCLVSFNTLIGYSIIGACSVLGDISNYSGWYAIGSLFAVLLILTYFVTLLWLEASIFRDMVNDYDNMKKELEEVDKQFDEYVKEKYSHSSDTDYDFIKNP